MSSGMLRRVALVSTNVSEKLSASFIRVTRIGEVGNTDTVSRLKTRLSSPDSVSICLVPSLEQMVFPPPKFWQLLMFLCRCER
jgi:hypothetical protein